MRQWIWQLMPWLALLIALTAASGALAADGPRLLLAGGALPVCSSATPQACAPGRVPGPAALRTQYRLDQAGIDRVATAWWQPHRRSAQRRVVAALARWLGRSGVSDLAQSDLPAALGSTRGAASAWTDLAPFEQARVWDALQRAPPAEQLAFDASTTESGANIYREFVAMSRRVAARPRPRILVSTASSRDPYAAIAFYLDLFEQAGADVRWLPLDHALRAAQAEPEQDCAHLDRVRGERWGAQDRARLYPSRAAELQAACRDTTQLRAALNWADGLFLNGGDQSFARAAWYADDGTATPELQLLRQRFAAGSLVLGGTSAGTAVQAASPGVMLVSGPALPSSAALALSQLPPDPDCRAADACAGVDPDALLMHPGGGLGSFPFGVLDTHFSERGRDYRLARVLLDSGSSSGVGIDENTALRLDLEDGQWRVRVLGRGGVTVLRRIDEQRLIWSRATAGADFLWPRHAAAPERCANGVTAARTLRADSTELRDALLAAGQRQAQPLRLASGRTLQAAGQVCIGSAADQRIWEFSPDPGHEQSTPEPATTQQESP